MRAVAKAVNGINSRWARKMKDAIYLGCCVALFFFFNLRSVPAARSSVHSNVLCFLRRFSLSLFNVAATRAVAFRGSFTLLVDGICSRLAVEYHVMDWWPLPSVTLC